jgi:serine/threonine protein kinase
MELLDGRGLDRVIEQAQRLEPLRALHLTQKLLHGLRYAHGRGVVHRDMKPENVLLVEQDLDPDFPKILDLGIAKLVGAENVTKTGITEKGELFGTPLYISPELLRGEELDGRADLYALTVMLYQMLTSHPPFYSSNSLGVFAMHLATPAPTLTSMAPELAAPPALEQLLARGMAKEPSQRIASADEYLAAIDELLVLDWPTSGAPQTAEERMKEVTVKRAPAPTVSAKAGTPHVRVAVPRPAAAGLWLTLRTSRSAQFGVVILALALAGLAYAAARQLSLLS